MQSIHELTTLLELKEVAGRCLGAIQVALEAPRTREELRQLDELARQARVTERRAMAALSARGWTACRP